MNKAYPAHEPTLLCNVQLGASARALSSFSTFGAGILAALYPLPNVHAQTDNEQEAENFVIEEILVTATKRTLNLQDVPQSIVSFDNSDIERINFKNMEDYVKALPSVSMTNSMPGRNSVVMRGISTGNAEYRTESQVAVYLDEQPITSISQQPEVRMIDIARIEVLPGPQGTLFGSSSQTGTMRIITNKPTTDEFSGQASGTLATTDGGDPSWDFNGHINIPVSDTLAFRLIGFYAHDGGYVDVVPGETFAPPEHGGAANNDAIVDNNQNTYDVYGGRFHALWLPNEKWEVAANLIGQYSEADGVWESDPYIGDYKVIKFFDEWRDDDWWQASVTVKGDLGFAEFVSTTSYFERDSAYEWDNMAYNQWLTSYYAGYFGPYDFDYEYGTNFNDQWQERFAQEFRLTSQSDSKLQWMLGAFYDDVYDEWEYGSKIPNFTKTTAWDAINYYSCYYSAYYESAPCPVPETDITYWNNYRRTIKQTAVFGEISYNFTDKLMATVGARWFEFDKDEYQQYYAPYLVPPPGSYGFGEGLTEAEGTESDTIFKVGLQYDINEDVMVYGLVSEGFRLGGRNSPRVVGNNPNMPAEYEPDTLTNYELGMKSTWMDNRLTLNASLFLMEWDGIQINSAIGPKWWQRGTWNGETGETRGAEINASFHITPNLLVEGSLFLADAEYTKDTFRPCIDPDDCEPTLWIEDGQEMPGSPDTKYWFAVEYTQPGAFGLGGEMWFRYDTSYQSETWDDLDTAAAQDPVGLIPSWSTANFQVGWGTESDWTYTLFIRNVWNDNGINAIYSSNFYYDYFGQTGASWLRTLQRPRTISFNVTKRF